jgi:hypothetical protein
MHGRKWYIYYSLNIKLRHFFFSAKPKLNLNKKNNVENKKTSPSILFSVPVLLSHFQFHQYKTRHMLTVNSSLQNSPTHLQPLFFSRHCRQHTEHVLFPKVSFLSSYGTIETLTGWFIYFYVFLSIDKHGDESKVTKELMNFII